MLILDFVANNVQADLPGCPASAMKKAVIDAAKDFLTESQVWNEIQDPLLILSGVNEYSLDAPSTGVKCIDIKAVYAPWMPRGELIGVSMDQLAFALPNWDTAIGGQPSHYTRAFDFSNFRVFPYPSNVPAGTQVRVHGVYTLTDTATQIPDDIVTRYGEKIASGAKYRLMLNPKKTWTDLQLAKYHKDEFENGKISAKVDAMHAKTSGDHRVPPRRFGQ
jgi:hypothetical protein